MGDGTRRMHREGQTRAEGLTAVDPGVGIALVEVSDGDEGELRRRVAQRIEGVERDRDGGRVEDHREDPFADQ